MFVMPKRGAGERGKIYKLQALAKRVDKTGDAKIEDTHGVHLFDGVVENLLVLSVPPDATVQTCMEVGDRVATATGKRVVVVSHNVSMLHAVEMTPEEIDALPRPPESAAT